MRHYERCPITLALLTTDSVTDCISLSQYLSSSIVGSLSIIHYLSVEAKAHPTIVPKRHSNYQGNVNTTARRGTEITQRLQLPNGKGKGKGCC